MKISLNKALYIVFLAVFISGMFGFVGMNHVQMNCDPETPDTTCPQMRWGEMFHNIEVYKSSMQATVSIVTILLISIATLLIVAVAALLPGDVSSQSDVLSVSSRRRSLEASHFHKQKIHSWLSRFELSPSLI